MLGTSSGTPERDSELHGAVRPGRRFGIHAGDLSPAGNINISMPHPILGPVGTKGSKERGQVSHRDFLRDGVTRQGIKQITPKHVWLSMVHSHRPLVQVEPCRRLPVMRPINKNSTNIRIHLKDLCNRPFHDGIHRHGSGLLQVAEDKARVLEPSRLGKPLTTALEVLFHGPDIGLKGLKDDPSHSFRGNSSRYGRRVH